MIARLRRNLPSHDRLQGTDAFVSKLSFSGSAPDETLFKATERVTDAS
jgi:hypothetical protein